MKAEDLKASLLQYAIQGRLVPQDPDDEPASVLLERIRGEKQRLVKEGKIRKDKNESRIYRREGEWFELVGKEESKIKVPFDVPESWSYVRLGNLCEKMGSGSTPKGGQEVYLKEGITFIRSQNVYNDGLRLNGVAYISDDVNSSMEGTIVHPYDLLLNITGASIGRCSIVPVDLGIANVNQHVMIIRLVLTELVEYLHCLICSPYMFKSIMGEQVGGTKEGLSAKKASQLLVPLPPLAEQKRIVAKLEELQPLIDRYAQNEEQLSQLNSALALSLRKSILQYAIQGRLVPQDPNDEPASVLLERIRGERQRFVKEGKTKKNKDESRIYCRDGKWFECSGDGEKPLTSELYIEIPEGWIWARLSSFADLVRGQGIKRNDVVNTGMPCIRYGELYTTYVHSTTTVKSYIDEDLYNKSKLINKGDLVLTLTGENKEDIGKALAYLGETPVACGGDMLLVRSHSMDPLFLTYLLNSPQVGVLKASYSKGDFIVHLSSTLMSSILLPIPPLAEQKRIVAKLDECLKQVERLEN